MKWKVALLAFVSFHLHLAEDILGSRGPDGYQWPIRYLKPFSQAAEFAFSRGAISVLEVLDARRTHRAVQLEALAARTDHAKALAAWRASLTSAQTLERR